MKTSAAKTILALALATTAFAHPSPPVPRIQFSFNRDVDSVPQMSVSFPSLGRSGQDLTDDIALEPFNPFLNPEDFDSSACAFTGHLASDPESGVAVTGCDENSEEGVEITIVNGTVGVGQFRLARGHVERIDSSFECGAPNGGVHVHEPGFGGRNAAGRRGDDSGMAPAYELVLALGYDDNLNGALPDPRGTIRDVMAHASKLLGNNNLASQMKLKFAGKAKHYGGRRFRAGDGYTLDDPSARALATEASAYSDLLTLFTFRSAYEGVKGSAWPGVVCKDGHRCLIHAGYLPCTDLQISVSEFWPGDTKAKMGLVAAHEIGHNLGVYHDISHGRSDCPDGKFIMAKYAKNQKKWSPCSREDQLRHYNQAKRLNGGEFCLKPVGTTNTCQTDKGVPCMFPFPYKGKTYNGCTMEDHKHYWCYINSNWEWGNCKPGCPRAS